MGVMTRRDVAHLAVRLTGSGASGLLNGLISYWDMTEASNATRVDAHGSNDAINNGTVAQVVGIGGSGFAAEFDNTSNTDWLEVADDASFNLGTNPIISMAGFAYAGSGQAINTDAPILSKRGGGGAIDLVLSMGRLASGKPYIAAFDSGNNDQGVGYTGTAVSPETYFHVAFTIDQTNNLIWISVDGSTKESASLTLTVTGSSSPLRFAGGNGFGTWSGRKARWGLWNRELTQNEIIAHRNGGAGLLYSEL